MPIDAAQTVPQMIPAWVEGVLTPVEKLAVHQRGLKHQAVSVFVMSGRYVLLQQRAAAKYHSGGKWSNTCCTHPQWGEAFDICAQRRLYEEMGIRGLSLLPVGQVEYRAEVGGGLIEHEVVELYVAQCDRNLPLVLNPDEAQASRWIEFGALKADVAANPDQYSAWLSIYLRDHSERISLTLS
ncbi:isopentenyl-diphosphate Delta-isomerase [Albirhodobacter sp. R86504]|uniref:isopentenyl-diphosphate Delta-isomerase n=1 Tax=Albirhodobacter sp. R86504 TaxID=3093848 RepID=UPI003671BB8D